MGKGKTENLHPPFTPEEAREYGSRGGKKSAESRRLKASMRDAAARWMINQTSMKINGRPATGEDVCNSVFDRVMARADNVSIELIKTFGKLLDGERLDINATVEQEDITEGMSYEEKKKLAEEWLAKHR
jgi:hypothetical protein